MKQTLLIFAILSSYLTFAQINFEKAYFINNADNRIECFIKNIDWKNNPTTFEYRTAENADIKIASIKDVKLFEIPDHVKYVREDVKIDRSGKEIRQLTTDPNFSFKEEQLFLKEIVAGDAILYQYNDINLIRFFYTKNNQPIKQLEYKLYISRQGEKEVEAISYNTNYKEQLKEDLVCSSITKTEIERTDYNAKSLSALFYKFNQCSNPQNAQVVTKTKKGYINLNIRPRVNFSSLKLANPYLQTTFDVKSAVTAGIGLEAEFVFPFNKNKWAIIFEPTYQSYKAEQETDAGFLIGGRLKTKVDYKSLELPIGLRHYMFLDDHSILFVNVQAVFDLNLNSSIDFSRNDDSPFNSLKLKSSPNVAVGTGYNYNKKYAVEARYNFKRNITSESYLWESDYTTFSLILSYNLF
ncbi:outer membrane beta-barrel protein [Kaistella jeonii]|uniref:Uncharacterized protein n=1 Tax=Kaistella jeonii TaxID=266749 RepID=A0A0C1D1A7_9FLAO|nr:outer membrane beta-barrel protein [Kaistella jeonii]KIA90526.1 hypothetical protein OA86_01175 [Kaistella jeonii]SFB71409.1 Outer membrane protein beta-barrel domain-containing protein [Kaistella jeonii]VEI94887.1 Uncharacterised protein [Kaistella jeonii]